MNVTNILYRYWILRLSISLYIIRNINSLYMSTITIYCCSCLRKLECPRCQGQRSEGRANNPSVSTGSASAADGQCYRESDCSAEGALGDWPQATGDREQATRHWGCQASTEERGTVVASIFSGHRHNRSVSEWQQSAISLLRLGRLNDLWWLDQCHSLTIRLCRCPQKMKP